MLTGKTGAARLAAETGAPVVPIGLWGTEQVWPRSSRLPDMTQLVRPPRVRVSVGSPLAVAGLDAVTDTERIMEAISGLLPADAHRRRRPTAAQLARTYPPRPVAACVR